jgi:hypothetical protein
MTSLIEKIGIVAQVVIWKLPIKRTKKNLAALQKCSEEKSSNHKNYRSFRRLTNWSRELFKFS